MIEKKPIKGHEGYEICSNGDVISYWNKHGGLVKNGHVLKPTMVKGYCRVVLQDNGKYDRKSVHRLVAEHFLDNPNGLRYVNHKNEIKTDNSVDNLEWCTQRYNANYGTRNERIIKAQGHKILCVETGEVFDSINQAGKVKGCQPQNIGKVLKGTRNKCGGFHWKYA